MIELGNLLPKLPRDGPAGIRMPSSLARRLGGYLLTAARLISLVSLPVGGARTAWVSRAGLLGAVALATAYSFVAYARRSRVGH